MSYLARGRQPLHSGGLLRWQVQCCVWRSGTGGGGETLIHPAGLRQRRQGPFSAEVGVKPVFLVPSSVFISRDHRDGGLGLTYMCGFGA